MQKIRRRKALSYDAQWTKWQNDLERIYTESLYVFENRHVFGEIMKMFQDNKQLNKEGGFVWDWLRGIYGRDMVLAIGREVDRHTEVVNLIQLMYQMTKRPRVVSRKRFFKMLDLKHTPGTPELHDHLRELNERWFTQNIGAGDFLDPAVIKKDRNWLEKRCKAVMKYRHKVVAHRSTMELSLTIKQIHDALDAVETMLKKYYVLLKGGALMSATPTIQFYWQKVFTIPWIQPSAD